TVGRSGWTVGRVVALVVGVVLVLVSLGLLASGGTGLWADRTQRDAGYATSDVHRFSTTGSALVTEPTQFGSAGAGWLYSPTLLGKGRVRGRPAAGGAAGVWGGGPAGGGGPLPGRGGRPGGPRLLGGQGGGGGRGRAGGGPG